MHIFGHPVKTLIQAIFCISTGLFHVYFANQFLDLIHVKCLKQHIFGHFVGDVRFVQHNAQGFFPNYRLSYFNDLCLSMNLFKVCLATLNRLASWASITNATASQFYSIRLQVSREWPSPEQSYTSAVLTPVVIQVISNPAVGNIYSVLLANERRIVVFPLFVSPIMRTVKETSMLDLYLNLNQGLLLLRSAGIKLQFYYQMSYRNSVDSTGTLFFTKYADPSQLNSMERQRFRSTFQASKLGDQRKMDQIQNMFNNYNLFKYGQVATSAGKKRHSTNSLPQPESNSNRHKNLKERMKDNLLLKQRLISMKNQRQGLFDKLQEITTKNPRKINKVVSVVSENM